MAYSYFLGVLLVALIFLIPVLVVTWLLHASGRLVTPLFSADRKLLLRRVLFGLLNWVFIVPVAWFFFPKVLTPLWLLSIPTGVVLVAFVSGLTLLVLAALQLFGMAFGRTQHVEEEQHVLKRAA